MSSTSTLSSPTSSSTASCITVTPGKNGYVPESACNAEWDYDPSIPAAIIFAVLFGITTFLHIFQAFYHKKIRLCWALVMGASWEFASFSIRVAGAKNQQSGTLQAVSQILVLIAPIWINAFIYMVLGRMIYFFLPEQQVWGIKGIKIAKIFVWLDVISFLTQVGGGVLISPGSSASLQLTGIHIYMGGIGLQEFCILIFTCIAIRFHVTLRQLSSAQVLDDRPRNWRPLLYILYTALALITARIIFRLIEFSSGLDPSKNPIPFHEAYFYCLDGLPMLIACFLVNIVHPGRVLKGEGSEFARMSRKEKKAAKAEKKEAKRLAMWEMKALKFQNKQRKNNEVSNV